MWNWISKAEELRSQGVPFIISTVTQVTGSTPRETGAKMLIQKEGRFFGTIGGGNLELLVLKEAATLFSSPRSRVSRYPLGAKTGQCCGGIVDVLFEPVNCGPQLYLFGAGHVGQAVCRSLANTSFTVHLVDDRPEWIQGQDVPKEIIRHETEWDDFVETAPWNENQTYAVIMTHRHDLDQDILQRIIHKPTKYLGLIGSESKWSRFRQRLLAREISEEALSKVRSPIGIPIGGKSPQEVAISLSAELLQIHYRDSKTHA